ncbi:cytochrome P450 [Mycolicibacterium sp. 3033]|nr:cytochrome P450 [Mycolicibacterium aurantiacum]
MTSTPEQHAENWDLRHEDFNDAELLYDVYAAMRRRRTPVHTDSPFLAPTPGGAWVVVDYDDCYRIAQTWQDFSSNPIPGMAPEFIGNLVVVLDPPRQQQLRKVLNPYFSPARMKALRPQIEAETDTLIDEFIEDGVGDLARVAWRQPGTVLFKHLLGMSVDEVPRCFELTDTALNGRAEQDRATAWADLYQHIHDVISARTSQPARDDMIDVLLHAEIDGRPLPFTDIVGNAMLLVQAGLETTANATSFAFHHLATHPGDRDRLVADPMLVPRAVEEFIRFAGSIHGLNRTVCRDVEVSGHRFAPGETVIINYAAANRDPDVFPDADRCVLDRRDNRHLGFGAGVHRCLGSNLARLEFQISLERVLARVPDFHLRPGTTPEFHGNSITRGFRSIPIAFSPGPVGVSTVTDSQESTVREGHPG